LTRAVKKHRLMKDRIHFKQVVRSEIGKKNEKSKARGGLFVKCKLPGDQKLNQGAEGRKCKGKRKERTKKKKKRKTSEKKERKINNKKKK